MDEFLAAASITAAARILSTWTSSRPSSTGTSQTSPGSALHRGQAKVTGLMATYSGGFTMSFATSHSEWTGRPSSFVPASLTATSLPPTKHVKIGVGMESEYWHLHYIIVGISETLRLIVFPTNEDRVVSPVMPIFSSLFTITCRRHRYSDFRT